MERLSAFNADVIVADLVMPRMDGFELLRHLKEQGDLTPAIVLTGCLQHSRFAHRLREPRRLHCHLR
jgi:two-component system response regulator